MQGLTNQCGVMGEEQRMACLAIPAEADDRTSQYCDMPGSTSAHGFAVHTRAHGRINSLGRSPPTQWLQPSISARSNVECRGNAGLEQTERTTVIDIPDA
jgi:hypothetical protein